MYLTGSLMYPALDLGVALGYDAVYLSLGGRKAVTFNPRLGPCIAPAGLFRLEGDTVTRGGTD